LHHREEIGMKRVVLWVAGVLAIVAGPAAAAEKYPTKPVRMIAPFPPGGGTDILSRVIAVPVAETLGQPVIVDNRPGAGGATGAETVAHSAPDGYTSLYPAAMRQPLPTATRHTIP
jgi:tripartite-type tricarboxylate transporter receptor subunit TctC